MPQWFDIEQMAPIGPDWPRFGLQFHVSIVENPSILWSFMGYLVHEKRAHRRTSAEFPDV
jgi:hypothetical protein